MPKKPILVVGDACQDIFVYCHCERLCPEAPVPVLDVINTEKNFGMAGNVYCNILSLSFPAKFLVNPNYAKVTKTRYIDLKTNHMFLRIDSTEPIPRVKNLKKLSLDKYSAIVISDYNKGFLTEEDICYLASHHPVTFLDTKKIIREDWAKNVLFIKINRKEYRNSKPFLTTLLEDRIIETLGSDGCRFKKTIYPVTQVEIKNLSGAGDSFLSGLAVSYLESNGNISESLKAANEAATIVVQKRGVSTIKNIE